MKYMTKEWYARMQRTDLHTSFESTLDKYWEKHQEMFKSDVPAFIDDFGFHDCKVTSSIWVGNDLILTLDNSGGFTETNQIIFIDCKIVKQDAALIDAWWLYEEVYRVANGYELHVLLQNDELIDFIITVQGVVYN